MPSGVAITHTYLADTTDPSTRLAVLGESLGFVFHNYRLDRSQYLSLALGLMFTGVAVGPALGGLLIRSTGTILSVFYLACILHGTYTILVLLILPESLTRARERGARLRRTREMANQSSSGRVLNLLKYPTRFLSPLVALFPEQSLDAKPLKPRRKDWSLFFIALAYGLVTSAIVSTVMMMNFPNRLFIAANAGCRPLQISIYCGEIQLDARNCGSLAPNWVRSFTDDINQISYYVSVMGATRALFLTVVLPRKNYIFVVARRSQAPHSDH